MQNKILYLPGLNGLRAIAALTVILCHTAMYLSSLGIGSLFNWNYTSARCAVTLFFVLSGFLITFLLLKEKEQSGISIKNFYLRRVLRIFPIYYLYIFVSLSVGPLVNMFHDLASLRVVFYLLFLGNISPFFGSIVEILGHYWSIGLEEQFYLLWPLLIKFNKKYVFKLVIAIIVVFVGLKVSGYFLLGKQSVLYIFMDINRFHCILFGAFGALLYFDKDVNFLTVVLSRTVQLLSWIAYLIISFDLVHIPSLLIDELFSITVLSIIVGQITVRKRLFNLDTSIFNFFGKISYGLYVFHPLVIIFISLSVNRLSVSSPIKCTIVYLLVISITTAISYFSYRYFEKPFLMLKEKFSSKKSIKESFALIS